MGLSRDGFARFVRGDATHTRHVLFLALASACAPAAPADKLTSPTVRTDPPLRSDAPSAFVSTAIASGAPTPSALPDTTEADCSTQPWPVFKPALATGAGASGSRPSMGPQARPAPKPTPPSGSSSSTISSGVVPGAAETVAAMAEDFRSCFTRQLCDDPKAHGKVRLTAKIDPLGQVSEVTSQLEGTIGPKGLACLESVMSSRLFNPAEGGIATLVVPLNLKPAE